MRKCLAVGEHFRAEGREEYAEDPIVVLNVNGNRYRFSKSKEKYYASKLGVPPIFWTVN